MTIDIETIGIGFDTSALVNGQRALKDTEAAANKTADAADKVGEKGVSGFRNFEGAASSAERQTKLLNSAIGAFNNLVGTALAGFGGSQLISQIDQYTKFTSQLKLATSSTNEYVASLESVRNIARDSQASLAGTGTLYARIANGTKELGIAQSQVAKITEVVNLGLKVSGATAAEAASAQLQLSQAFASGTLRGEEFNAVNEAAPRLMKALADGIGVPVGALKDMASKGKITSEVMSRVLPKALEELREEARS
ncbi:MAG: tape measure protein, partial [Burkholderiaceae bacterium]|nr:tape measure protein [Burkholderiaceae bacterium]